MDLTTPDGRDAVALTGRLALLAAAAAVVVGLVAPTGWAVLVATLLLLALAALDVALAGPVGPLQLHRDGDVAVRLGEPAAVRLTVTNPSGRRVRGRLRDAWPPSAGAHEPAARPRRARRRAPPGDDRAAAHPPR